jgi:hypothetical protein
MTGNEERMKAYEMTIMYGGMFRCCIETVNQLSPDAEFNDGDTIDCKFEDPGNKAIIVKDGAFWWNENGREIPDEDL